MFLEALRAGNCFKISFEGLCATAIAQKRTFKGLCENTIALKVFLIAVAIEQNIQNKFCIGSARERRSKKVIREQRVHGFRRLGNRRIINAGKHFI
jgi:hypothetical protein